MTDWRSSDDPARAGQDPARPAQYGAYPPADQPLDPYGSGSYPTDPYAGNPYGGNPYAGNPYAGEPYAAQPGPYGQQPGAGYGYGYPPLPGYPAMDPADARPGTVIAAAVLGYVTAGLLIIAAFYCFVGASALANFDNDFGTSDNGYTVQFVLAGVVNLVAAGLLIGGAVTMTSRKPTGRVMYLVACGLVLIASVYWAAQWATKDGLGGLSVFAVLFVALVIVGASLAFTGGNSRWLARLR